MEATFLQNYWWLIISVLAGALVFLLMVQGGQSLLWCAGPGRQLMVNSLGHKWELTFTTLVVFGGAFFASFPLFYSTSFGGAYWLWMLILLSFVVQAFSYEFRRKRGNLYGTGTYDFFLMFNGLVGCVLLGVAVGMMFFGGQFVVTKGNLLDLQAPVISQWAPSRGLEAIINWKCLVLGFMVFFLARTQALMFFKNNIVNAGQEMGIVSQRKMLVNGGAFVVLFLLFVGLLLFQDGYRQQPDGSFALVENIYLDNLLTLWWAAITLAIGVVLVLWGYGRALLVPAWRRGIWLTGIGTALVVMALFWLAGYNATAYLPSTIDPQSSLTITNSSSTPFTLEVMAYVSILVPFVLAYIAYVWYKMDAKPLSDEELSSEPNTY